MSYQATNKIGIIVSNNKFKTTEKQPDLTGTMTFPDGKQMEVSLWKRMDEEGKQFLAGEVKDKWVKPEGYVSKAPSRPQTNQQYQNSGRNQNKVQIDF
jgi:hypothetical protein